MDTTFVEVYDTRTLKVSRVPREWVGNPVLGRFIRLTVEQRELDGAAAAALVEAEEPADQLTEEPVVEPEPVNPPPPVVERPTEDATAKEIEAFAEGAGIDLAGAKGSKAAKVARINEELDTPVEPTPDPADTPSSDETPATGDEEI